MTSRALSSSRRHCLTCYSHPRPTHSRAHRRAFAGAARGAAAVAPFATVGLVVSAYLAYVVLDGPLVVQEHSHALVYQVAFASIWCVVADNVHEQWYWPADPGRRILAGRIVSIHAHSGEGGPSSR